VGSPDPIFAQCGPLMGMCKDDNNSTGFIQTVGDSYRQLRAQQTSYFKNIQFLQNYAARYSYHGQNPARYL